MGLSYLSRPTLLWEGRSFGLPKEARLGLSPLTGPLCLEQQSHRIEYV